MKKLPGYKLLFCTIILLTTLLLMPSGRLYATERFRIYEPPPPEKNQQKYFILKLFTPSALLEVNRTLFLGFEAPITRQWSITADGGYIFKSLMEQAVFNKEKLSYDGRIGIRYYWPASTLKGFYTGAEFFYREINYNVGQEYCTNWIYDSIRRVYTCEEELKNIYDLRRNELAAILKFGFQPVFYKRLALDFSFGIGAKQIKSATTGKIEGARHPDQTEEPEDKFMVNDVVPVFPITVKLGLAF